MWPRRPARHSALSLSGRGHVISALRVVEKNRLKGHPDTARWGGRAVDKQRPPGDRPGLGLRRHLFADALPIGGVITAELHPQPQHTASKTAQLHFRGGQRSIGPATWAVHMGAPPVTHTRQEAPSNSARPQQLPDKRARCSPVHHHQKRASSSATSCERSSCRWPSLWCPSWRPSSS